MVMNVVRKFVKVKFKPCKNGSKFVEIDGLKSETSSDMYRNRNRKLQNTVSKSETESAKHCSVTACQKFNLAGTSR